MSWGIGEPAVRFGAIAFGVLFCGVVIAVTAADPSLISGAIGAVLIAGGLLVIASGIVGVPMRAGEFVGGGPALRRIELAPDESIIAHCWGACQPARARLSSLTVFFNRGQGEVFITDRRIIVADWRLQSPDPPVALPLRDIAEVRESHRATLAALGADSLDVVTRAGLTYVFWFWNRAVAAKLREMLANATEFPEVSSDPFRSTRVSTVSARIVVGLSGLLILTVFTFGQTSSPYVGGPNPFLLVWVIYTSVGLYQLVDFIREMRQRRLL